MSAHLELDHLSKVFGLDKPSRLKTLHRGLSKARLLESSGQVIGARDVSLTIESGELFVVMELSGSGKLALVRMTNRLIKPTAGPIASPPNGP